ncbi:MAG: hypothetical protein KKD59_07735 [Acidobacteria bacterium]|nr:hypothetical protein [Acidobacteriota bacterium]
MKKTNIGLGILVIVVGLILMNAERVEDLIEESQSVPLDGLVSARVILDTGIAKLNVSGGADGLLNGHFSYNVKRWQPEIIKEWEGDHAVVSVRQKKSTRIPIGPTKNVWDIELNDRIPIDLHVDLGIGESRLDLAGLDLEGLNVDVGIGEAWIDLSGVVPRDMRVRIDGGIGSTTVYLPRNIGVRVQVDKGLGSVSAHGFDRDGDVYTNDAYRASDQTIEVTIDAGIGSVDLRIR